jgi:hypothetical protein
MWRIGVLRSQIPVKEAPPDCAVKEAPPDYAVKEAPPKNAVSEPLPAFACYNRWMTNGNYDQHIDSMSQHPSVKLIRLTQSRLRRVAGVSLAHCYCLLLLLLTHTFFRAPQVLTKSREHQ